MIFYFIKPFTLATIKVFDIQMGLKVSSGSIYLRDRNENMVFDIAGMLKVVGTKLNCTILLSFTEGTFLKIISKLIGEDLNVINDDVLDGVCELINMIFGQAKIPLNEAGHEIKMALPTALSGKNQINISRPSGKAVVIPFNCHLGNFELEMIL
jgi:chemotaxis protein CheX